MEELNPLQKQVLDLFARSALREKFYWTGGTLLSTVYLHHRRSEDLDFFSDSPFSHDDIIGFVRELKEKTSLAFVEEKKIFDRWEFFLHNQEEVRLEFVHYDHPRIKEREVWNGILIDSLSDCATNKLMALFDRNEPKDVVDLYFLLTKGGYAVETLLQFVEQKFGVRFEKSAVWSEAFKGMKELEAIEPLLSGGTEEEKNQTLENIKDYFSTQSKEFLDRELE
jgi:predicted nucleotidyltransferase component of viral defense system